MVLHSKYENNKGGDKKREGKAFICLDWTKMGQGMITFMNWVNSSENQ